MDINYEYFLNYIKTKPSWKNLIILDYGCGRGEIVRLLRSHQIECYGTDLYDALNASLPNVRDLLRKGYVKPLRKDGAIPFPIKFDIIISNQVIEHISKLNSTFDHLIESLHPYGIMYHHFPTQETIREGHIGIPLAHQIPNSQLRFYYTLCLRFFGLGSYKQDLSIWDWTHQKLAYLDSDCFYRKYSFISHLIQKKHKFIIRPKEIEYIRFRCREYPLLKTCIKFQLFENLFVFLFRRLGFVTIELVPLPTKIRILNTPKQIDKHTLWRSLALSAHPFRDYNPNQLPD
jgi:SAM-dependent methyltransferase